MTDFPKRTGDFEVATNVTFEIVIPDVLWLKRAVAGALFELTKEENWREVGTTTIYQVTQIMTDIYDSLEL